MAWTHSVKMASTVPALHSVVAVTSSNIRETPTKATQMAEALMDNVA